MGGITNLLGGGGGSSINLVAIDTSLIASANNAALNLRLVGQIQNLNPSAFSSIEDPVNVTKPWSEDVDTRTDTQKRLDFLSDEDLISFDQPYFNNIANTSTDKNLFALYNGLTRMKDLADYAAGTSSLTAELKGLDRRLQEYISEFDTALEDLDLVGVSVLRGEKTDKITIENVTPKETGDFQTGIITDQGFEGAIASLAGTETFTITVNGTDVNIDLSDISGTISIKSLSEHLNSELDAAGFSSFLSVGRYQEYDDGNVGTGRFGLTFDAVSTASISFSTGSSAASLTVLGNSGGTNYPGIKTERLSDLGSADPSVEVSSIADYEDKSETTITSGSAIDSSGNVFTVGYTNQDLGGQLNQSTDSDAFLRKYDSAGNLLWEQLLGAKETASGVDIAVDANDNVIIVGQVTGDLGDQAIFSGGRDTFISKFDNDGAPQWTRQIGASVNDDAYGVTTDSSGNVYVVGQTQGQISTGTTATTAIGDKDGFLLKIDSNGNLSDAEQFGTTGFDRAGAVGVANDGNPVVASVENGQLFVRKYDASDLSSMQWEINLGSFDFSSGDSIGGIAVNGTEIYVTGASSNANLDESGTATITQASSGGKDGFVFKINDAGGTATSDWVSYLGTAGTDDIQDIAFAEGAVFVTGVTDDEFAGETESSDNSGFAAKVNTSGTTDWVHQFATRTDLISNVSLVVDPAGDSVLTKLGLGRGSYNPLDSVTITAQTTVRDGQYFYLEVDGEQKKITIENGDDLDDLERQIKRAFPFDVDASVLNLSSGSQIKIEAKGTSEVKILKGDGNFDALPGLGIDPTSLIGGAEFVSIFTLDRENPEDLAKRPDVWGLGLEDGMNVLNKTEAARTAEILDGALKAIRDAYRWVNPDPFLENLFGGDDAITGPAPAYISSQINNYAAALQRLNPGAAASFGLF